MSEHKDKDHDCECKKEWDPCCSKRMQGEQGVQGVQGARGQDGLQGPQGIEGKQGIPGSCVNCGHEDDQKCHCPIEYMEVYSSLSQTLSASLGANLPGQVVLFENFIVATSNLDTSLAASTGQVKILLAGWYKATFGVTGSINPIPSPLPVWTVSLFNNNVLVPASTFANLPLSPEQHASEEISEVLFHAMAGDMISVANTSTANLLLSSPSMGTNASVNSATLILDLRKAD